MSRETSPNSRSGLRDLSHKQRDGEEGVALNPRPTDNSPPEPPLFHLQYGEAHCYLEALLPHVRKVEVPHGSRVCVRLMPLTPRKTLEKEQCQCVTWGHLCPTPGLRVPFVQWNPIRCL